VHAYVFEAHTGAHVSLGTAILENCLLSAGPSVVYAQADGPTLRNLSRLIDQQNKQHAHHVQQAWRLTNGGTLGASAHGVTLGASTDPRRVTDPKGHALLGPSRPTV